MSYIQQYISNYVDEAEDIQPLLQQIRDLGFDPSKEKPTVLSLIQTTEGFDLYDELYQHLQIKAIFHHSSAFLSITFRSIREEQETVFKLNDITVRLYAMENETPKEVTEKSFGKTPGFPLKEQMIKETIDRAENLSRAKNTSSQLRSPPLHMGGSLRRNRQGKQ